LENAGQILFTQHMGSAMDEVRQEIALEAAANILQALYGAKPAAPSIMWMGQKI
jgi:phosphonate dehydrogenase